MNNLLGSKITLIAIGLLILGGITVVALQDDATSSNNQVDPVSDLVITDSDHVKGNKGSKVVLMEYGDFQCPACGSQYPLLRQLVDEYGDRVAFVFRHFPLSSIHKNALTSSRAAEAASRQGKFWEMHNLLFERQGSWSDADDADSIFSNYASEIGLDLAKFSQDYGASEVDLRVRGDYEGGVGIGINSTPTFFLNGQLAPTPRNYDQWKQLIDQALAGS